jgi:hypothetical protein
LQRIQPPLFSRFGATGAWRNFHEGFILQTDARSPVAATATPITASAKQQHNNNDD